MHFSFILPDERDLSVTGILGLAKALVYRKGIKGLVVDPWNELSHQRPPGLSETEYISESLTKIRRFARAYGVHVFLIAHPTKLSKDKDGKLITTRSQTATYDGDTGIMILRGGRPTVQQGDTIARVLSDTGYIKILPNMSVRIEGRHEIKANLKELQKK